MGYIKDKRKRVGKDEQKTERSIQKKTTERIVSKRFSKKEAVYKKRTRRDSLRSHAAWSYWRSKAKLG